MDATKTKPFNIDKKLVYDAYKAVKTNAGAAGVDGQSLEQFAQDLGRNLYKIWNVSGSPPPSCNARLGRHDVAHIRDVESHIWLTI